MLVLLFTEELILAVDLQQACVAAWSFAPRLRAGASSASVTCFRLANRCFADAQMTNSVIVQMLIDKFLPMSDRDVVDN